MVRMEETKDVLVDRRSPTSNSKGLLLIFAHHGFDTVPGVFTFSAVLSRFIRLQVPKMRSRC